MADIRQWSDIQDKFSGGALLLGNGASMAIHPGFGYGSLREAAEKNGHITPEVTEIFRAFDTPDFELVLRRLWEATLVNKALGIEPGKVEQAYQQVRKALIATVRDVHISHSDAKKHLAPMYRFMKCFETVFCLNYDLLVYWAMMESQEELTKWWFKDCFEKGGVFPEEWESKRKKYGGADGTTLVFYPHGSLITAMLDDYTEAKIAAGGENLLREILDRWEKCTAVPLFVSEGTTEHKKQSIARSSYLSRVFREALPNPGEALVIYGWSISPQDSHILSQLRRTKTAPIRVAVSVYRDNQASAQQMEDALRAAGIDKIEFFDAESPGCWIYPTESKQ
jgi:hypothetical protein